MRARHIEPDAPVRAPILVSLICTPIARPAVGMRAGSSALMPPRMIVQLRTMLFSACALAKCDKT
ncbi:hypothetical protein XavaCFBP5823_17505 [Xanthomonas axonopodis pv. vasculorum]|nr:hypothetical protein XavaCFBP5823_17505 [Xanthomonas axonopodis pv. vasculorum]